MKNAQELIDAIKDVPEELFDQNYYDYSDKKNCGCIMYHYEMKKNGKLNPDTEVYEYADYFDISFVAWSYIFANDFIINDTAQNNGWPICEEFTVQSAIERIKFIDSLTKEK